MAAQGLDAGASPDLAMDRERSEDAGPTDAQPSKAGAVGNTNLATPVAEAGAPNGRLSGRVLARGSRTALVAAKVTATEAAGQRTTAETDDDGRFEMALPCGPSMVAIHAPGYEPISVSRNVCFDPSVLVVRLRARPDLPVYETVVIAPRDEPKIELRRQELTSTPGALGDPLRTIESMPGVATVAWPAPIYAIRGSNPGNTGYYLDDVQVPMLFHLALGPSVIHPYLFDSMAFYPGGYPAKYGRYVAGIVAAKTRAPAEDGLHASAEVRLYDAGVLVSAPWPDGKSSGGGKGGVTAAFRYSYTGALLSLLQSSVHLAYWDYQLRADRKVGEWRLSLLVMGSSDNLSYDLESTAIRREYDIRFHRAGLRASRTLGKGRLDAQLVASADHSSAPIVQGFPVTVDAYSLIPRLGYGYWTEHVDFEAGLDGQLQWFLPMSGVPMANASDLGSKRTVLLGGAYGSTTIRAGSRLSVTPGLRFDSYTIGATTRSDLGPRLSARLRLDDKTWLNFSGGRFSQAPSLSVQIPGAENFGLKLYGLQTSWQGALGVGTRYARAVEIEATGYLQGYVLTDLRDPTLTNHDPRSADFLVSRNARSYGLELLIRRPQTERLYGWISYTLSKSERALGGGVAGPSDWDQRHILNAVLGYRIGSYTLGSRVHINTGRPVLVRNDEDERFQRVPTFYQLDLRVERRMTFDAFTLDVYLEIVNTTATRTVLGLEQNPFSGQITEESYRIVLPSLGIRGEL